MKIAVAGLGLIGNQTTLGNILPKTIGFYITELFLQRRVIGYESPYIDISHRGVTEDESRGLRFVRQRVVLACSRFARVER